MPKQEQKQLIEEFGKGISGECTSWCSYGKNRMLQQVVDNRAGKKNNSLAFNYAFFGKSVKIQNRDGWISLGQLDKPLAFSDQYEKAQKVPTIKPLLEPVGFILIAPFALMAREIIRN